MRTAATTTTRVSCTAVRVVPSSKPGASTATNGSASRYMTAAAVVIASVVTVNATRTLC